MLKTFRAREINPIDANNPKSDSIRSNSIDKTFGVKVPENEETPNGIAAVGAFSRVPVAKKRFHIFTVFRVRLSLKIAQQNFKLKKLLEIISS